MAHVPLVPIGNPRASSLDDRSFEEHREAVTSLESTLRDKRGEVHAGWGPKYVDRVHAKGKLTARERIEILRDPGTRIFEVGTFVNFGDEFQSGLRSPGAGVVTAYVCIEGRWCMVIANDNTVASGAWWPRTPEKIERAQTMALRLRLPTIYLVDCSGLFLPEQSRSFPGATGAGHIFKKNSLLSASGVPQIAGVFGDCIAGGGYMPIISDRVYMTEQAYMVIAGAALIKGAKSEKITSLDIGGPRFTSINRVAPTSACPTTTCCSNAFGAKCAGCPARRRTSIAAAWGRPSRDSRAPSSPGCFPSITARPTTPARSWRACAIRACSGKSCPRSARR
jgi:hypothetical protein